MKLFVIVAVLVAAVAAEEQKIVGGDIAEPNSIPFMVSIQVRTRRGYRHVCGGSLYNNLTVITSGNCARFRMRRMRVVVGEHNLRRREGTEHMRAVVEKVVHPDFDNDVEEVGVPLNDIALLRLEEAVEMAPRPDECAEGEVVESDAVAQAVALPADETIVPEAGTMLRIAGWGSLRSGSRRPSSVLRTAEVPVVSDEQCAESYGIIAEPELSQAMMCAGFDDGGVDSCRGDGGGPLFCAETQTLYGIVSWGRGCAEPDFPGVYTEVAPFRSWIMENAFVE